MTGEQIFFNVLDDRYRITVVRTRPYQGVLTIVDKDTPETILFQKDVGLSYNAEAGPDIDDMMEWQQIAVEFAARQ